MASPSAVNELKARLRSEPKLAGRLTQYEFTSVLKMAAVFSEKKPFDAVNPCITVETSGGDDQVGTVGSRAFVDLMEIKIHLNMDSSPNMARRLGHIVWDSLDRYIAEVTGGKFWYTCLRPELYQENNELICSIDVQAKFMES